MEQEDNIMDMIIQTMLITLCTKNAEKKTLTTNSPFFSPLPSSIPPIYSAVFVTVAVTVAVSVAILDDVFVTVVSAGPFVIKHEQALEICFGPLSPRLILIPPGRPMLISS
jgi:hypothetical protein